jgi:hypothetical protein
MCHATGYVSLSPHPRQLLKKFSKIKGLGFAGMAEIIPAYPSQSPPGAMQK